MTQRTKIIPPQYRARSSGLRGAWQSKGGHTCTIIKESAAMSRRHSTVVFFNTAPMVLARAESIASKTASGPPPSTTMSVQEFLADRRRALASHVGPQSLSEPDLCLLERHQGVVARVEGGEVVVRYNSGDECFELSYAEEQFQQGALPKRGDQIEACVALWREPYKPKALSDYLSESEIAELREDASTGVRGRVEL